MAQTAGKLTRRVGACAAIGMFCMAGSGVASGQTLSEAIADGLKNPQVREAAANRRSIDAELRRARSFYLPTIDARGATGEEWTNSPFTRNRQRAPGDDGDAWLRRDELSLTLRQMVFDGWSTDSSVERQKARVSAAASRVNERSEFIAADISEAYLQVLRDLDLVRFTTENVAAHERLSGDVRGRVQGGRSGVGDQRQTETRLASARADRSDTLRRLEDSKAGFIRLVGMPPVSLRQPTLPEALVPKTLEEAIQRAKDANPSVRVARLDVLAALAEIDETSAPFWPRLDIELSGARNHNIDGIRGMSNDFTAMLVARWNLYRGGGDVANRTAAIERVNEARERVLRFDRQSEEDVRRAWNAFTLYRQQEIDLSERVTGAEQVLQAYSQQFNVGRRELLDLLDAQNDLFLARTSLATARQARLFAGYRLLALTGDLLRSLDLTPPAEATTPPAGPLFGNVSLKK
jgi:adhesin transport system outer membrane protein